MVRPLSPAPLPRLGLSPQPLLLRECGPPRLLLSRLPSSRQPPHALGRFHRTTRLSGHARSVPPSRPRASLHPPLVKPRLQNRNNREEASGTSSPHSPGPSTSPMDYTSIIVLALTVTVASTVKSQQTTPAIAGGYMAAAYSVQVPGQRRHGRDQWPGRDLSGGYAVRKRTLF